MLGEWSSGWVPFSGPLLTIAGCSSVPFGGQLVERPPSVFPAGPGPGDTAAGSGECAV